MTNTREVILKLKEVRAEKNLSFDQILSLMEQNDEYVSKSTLSRVFAEGSEGQMFRYETTLRPIANALLDIENEEDYDNADIKAFKSLLKLKMSVIDENVKRIEELQEQIKEVENREKLKYHDKLEKHDSDHQKSVEFLKNQIELKDKRIDQLLDANSQLLTQLLSCPCRKNDEIGCKE